jgi:hypothetical protein
MRDIRFRSACVLVLGAAAGACAPPMRNFPQATRVVVVSDDEDRSQLRVPPGHLPRVGQCRVWFPGRPPGQQPRAGTCNGIERVSPPGSWILYRPTNDRRVVHARVIDPKRAGVVLVVRVYDVERGTYLGQERADEKAGSKAKAKSKGD